MPSHDAYRNGTVTNLTYATSAGTAVSTAGFGAQTYWISLTAPGAFTTTGGVRYLVDTAPVCTTTNGALLPFNWTQVVKVTWTQVVKVTAGRTTVSRQHDGIGGTLVVVELTT